MASIAGTNVVYASYRNSVVGKTSDFSARVDCDTDTLCAVFQDNNDDTPADTDVFTAAISAGFIPTFANRLTLTNVTAGSVGTGVVDFDNPVFTGSSVLTGTDPLESFVVFKSTGADATSPLLAHYGNATGLAITPNGADVTVVANASGAWTF